MYIRGSYFIAAIWLLTTSLSCSNGGPGNSAGPETAANTPKPEITSADPRAEIENAIKLLLDAKSYRMKKELASSNGDVQTVEAEYSAPDRTHFVQYSNKTGATRRETIIIGKGSFVKAGTEPWKKSSLSISDLLAQFYPSGFADAVKRSKEIRFLGTDTVDGITMKKYEYSSESSLEPGKQRVEQIWIGADDGKIYQLQREGETIINGQPATTRSTRKLFDYGAELKIEPPI